MKTTTEKLDDGTTVFFVATRDDNDAHEQLMMLTGQFLDMLEHVARFHSQVISEDYAFDLANDLRTIGAKYGVPVGV